MSKEHLVGVQTSTEPFNFRSLGVQPELNDREALRYWALQALNRHTVPGKTGEVPVPASRNRFFTALIRATHSTGVLPCGAGGYRRQWSEL